MEKFSFYFSWGWHHIISWDAKDHILFIIVLAAIYMLNNWKQVLVLVTAFTIGHSLTLALSVYNVIRIKETLVEILIPCTIIITALFNFFQKDFQAKNLRLNYFLALFFGLIHGMGFASAIRFSLSRHDSIAVPLFSFNVGLEAGQICLVTIILLLSYMAVYVLKLKRKWWVWGLSAIGLVWGAILLIQNL